jgi:hypothetical protein
LAGTGHANGLGGAHANVKAKPVDVTAVGPGAPDGGPPGRLTVDGRELVQGERKDEAPQATGAPTPAAAYDPSEMNPGELELLPAKRRSVVKRYFEMVREGTGGSPSGTPLPPPPSAGGEQH